MSIWDKLRGNTISEESAKFIEFPVSMAEFRDIETIYNSLSHKQKAYIFPNGEPIKKSKFLSYLYIERVNNNPAGFVECYNNPHTDNNSKIASIVIAVSPNYQHQGIGLKLLKQTETDLKKRHYKKLLYNVESGNDASYNLARKAGFKEVNQKPDPDGVMIIYLEKNI